MRFFEQIASLVLYVFYFVVVGFALSLGDITSAWWLWISDVGWETKECTMHVSKIHFAMIFMHGALTMAATWAFHAHVIKERPEQQK